MKKILLAGMLVCGLVGCSTGGQSGQEVQTKTTMKFPYKYEIVGVDMYGNGSPWIAVIVQIEDKFVPISIHNVPSEVSYDKLVGSMIYSTEEIKDVFYDRDVTFKIKEK